MQILDAAYGKEALAKEIVVPVEGSATGWVFRAREPLILARLDSGRFPAGTYTVTEATPGVLLIRNEKLGSDAAFVQAHSLETTKPQDSGKLIFNRYGDTYFLNQVSSDCLQL